MDIVQKNAYSEVNAIITLLGDNYKSKIPPKLLKYFEENQNTSYETNINSNTPVEEFKISNTALIIISVLNLKYWEMDKNKKEKLKEIYLNNEKEFQEKIRLDVFSNHIEITSDKVEEKALVKVEKESIISKIFKFFRHLFLERRKIVMSSEAGFSSCDYSIEELEQFRDENGFIDLTNTGIVLTDDSREKKGTAKRIKNWVDFRGRKALLRGKAKLTSEDEITQNYSVYAELIVEEFCKAFGIPAAHYDLIKMMDESGDYQIGVLSESILDMEHEDLISLHDLVGYEPETDVDRFSETTSYEFVIDTLIERLQQANYSETEIQKLLVDLKKRMVFQLLMVDVDKHPENISFIKPKDPNQKIRLSPNYDSEFSLALQYTIENVKFLLSDDFQLESEVNQCSDPKIGTFISKKDGGRGCMWADTLEILIEDDDVYDYFQELVSIIEKVSVDEILHKVEARMKTPLPEDVKKLVKKVFETRLKNMEAVVRGDELDFDTEIDDDEIFKLLSDEEDKGDPEKSSRLLDSIIGRTLGVRLGEQIRVGSMLESQLKDNPEKETEDSKSTNENDTNDTR